MPNYRLNRTPVVTPPPPPPPHAALVGKFITLTPLVYENAVFEQLHAASHGDDKRQSVWSFLPYGPFPDATAMCAYYQGIPQDNDPMFYNVQHTDGEIAGIVSYLRITPPAYSIEIGHIWHAVARQRGRANTEAVFLLIENAFALGYRRVEWKCDACNIRSRQAALRLGFAFEGVFRQCTISQGKNRDTAWFAIIDRDWPPMRDNFRRWLATKDGAFSLAEANRPLVDWSLSAHDSWPV